MLFHQGHFEGNDSSKWVAKGVPETDIMCGILFSSLEKSENFIQMQTVLVTNAVFIYQKDRWLGLDNSVLETIYI